MTTKNNKKTSMLERLAAAEADEKRLAKKEEELKETKPVSKIEITERKSTSIKKEVDTLEERIKVIIEPKKDEKTFSVTRVSERDHSLLKSIIFKFDTTFHEVVEKMIDSIPESIISKSKIVNNMYPKTSMTNMKIYSSDHKVIKKLAHKHDIPQHQVISAYISIAEFNIK